ncbi:sugar ABC transporter permease [Halarchaeum grantii]|uniref:Sugar ABC transporter permease n=2 Tax=Halarchaeum grantii TaxID=1193105 RepID=A0A830F599_9EURY|nr:ABC transporter permease [Halarchaeum grantii]GGL42083.1 sugar ABC transporter permease [Halarchaeum grantii]
MAQESQSNPVREWYDEYTESRSALDIAVDLGPFLMLVILMAIFTATSGVFLTFDNLVGNVLMNSMILLFVALAGTFPILQQSIDLSVASIVSLSGVAMALLVSDYQLGMLALPIGVLVGTGVGLLNGIVFAKGKIPSFLVTLGSLSIFGGSALLITGGYSVPFNSPAIRQLAIGHVIPQVPNLVIWGLVTYVIVSLIAWKTTFGRYTYALGENERVADFSGVKVDRYKIGAFVLSGTLCGLAGVLLSARITSATPGMGSGLLLQSIAAIVMGGTALTGGVGGPHRTILGVLVIGVLTNGMNLLSIQSFVQEIILGFVVIFAVAMSMDRDKIDIVK